MKKICPFFQESCIEIRKKLLEKGEECMGYTRKVHTRQVESPPDGDPWAVHMRTGECPYCMHLI